MSRKAVVLDANILIRAVMGKRVRELIFLNFLGLIPSAQAMRGDENESLRQCQRHPLACQGCQGNKHVQAEFFPFTSN